MRLPFAYICAVMATNRGTYRIHTLCGHVLCRTSLHNCIYNFILKIGTGGNFSQ